ncbi:elongation of very long chain fatty acids protein 4-like [Achroia grisella]|uniref:elongation of very long chain fatty acids protein 4-like n=1 Tax=Achroia grisella TaxID=688607 RepID=UPI0027D2BD2D|nr:elongation of very long chain fatty acids protein 4-like [Achroia grisella]
MEYQNISIKSAVGNLLDFKSKEDYVDKWFLMESPIPILAIWITYVLFVLKIGPETMKKREAFSLRNVIILYNTLQVAVSIFIFNMGMSLLHPVGYVHVTCVRDDVMTRNISWGIYLYFLAKLSELLDTVFFVLRKKQNQVSFLHIYHHSIMLWLTWLTLKFEPTYSTTFLGTLNTFVHIIMYTYYGLSAFPSIAKFLWWKKYITLLQLTQFVLVLIHTLANYAFTDCPPSYILLYAILGNGLLFIYLFADFYMKSYKSKDNEMKKSNKSIKNGLEKQENGVRKENYCVRNCTSCDGIAKKTH